MDKIAISLLPYVGIPALLVVVGVIADSLCDDHYKIIFAEKISAGRSAGGIRSAMTSIDKYFISRTFGRKYLSIRFFFASFVFSLGIFITIVVAQGIYARVDVSMVLSAKNYVGTIFICLLFLVTALVDVLCNIFATTLIRITSRSQRIFDALVSFIANISLTATVFTFVFPFGLISCLLLNQIFEPYFAMHILPVSQIQNDALQENMRFRGSLLYNSYEVNGYITKTP